MKLNLLIKIIFSFLLFVCAFAEAASSPKCSAVLMFPKQEVEAKVTAIVKTILTYQMNTANGVQGNNPGYIEATRQINEIVNNLPEMLEFYNSEMVRLAKKDSAIKRKVKSRSEKDSVLDQVGKIEDSVVVLEIDDKPHFIFKKKDGSYFIIGSNKEFLDFFNQQKNVQQVITTKSNKAIGILKKDGSVITWGEYEIDGDASYPNLTNIKKIYSTKYAFAALKNDGSVVAWGGQFYGGNSSHLVLTNVKAIYSTDFAFATLKNDGSVIVWGNKEAGGNSSQLDLTNVHSIYSTSGAFAALKKDGTVISWGDKYKGGDSSHLGLTNVLAIYSTDHAFAALKNDGSVITWGDKVWGGGSYHINLSDVKTLNSTGYAFAALINNGSVITWGDKDRGGDSSHLDLTNIQSIYSTEKAFAALKNDGSVTTWGNKNLGGDSKSVQNHLYDIVRIIEVKTGSFLALRKDGKFILWGKPIGEYQNQVLDFDIF